MIGRSNAVGGGGGPTYEWVDLGVPSLEGSGFSKEYVFRYSAPSPGWTTLVFLYSMQEEYGIYGDFLGTDGEILLEKPERHFDHQIEGESITSKCSQSLINRTVTGGYAIFLY